MSLFSGAIISRSASMPGRYSRGSIGTMPGYKGEVGKHREALEQIAGPYDAGQSFAR
jgi:hypothetical protein